MNAEHVEDLVDLEALGALDAAESAFVRAHAAACPVCRAALAGAEEVAARLALLAPMHRAPLALRGRVLAAAAADERVARPGGSVLPFVARGPSAIMRFNRKWGTMAAVLFLAPVAGLLTWAYVLQNQVNDLKEQNQQISDQQRDFVILSAGPTVRARFSPTDVAEQATGEVTWSPEDGKCMVSVRRLPRPEGGASYHVFYQGWRGAVDVGELRPDTEGAAALVFDASKWKGDTYEVWVAAVKSGADEAPVLLQASLRRE